MVCRNRHTIVVAYQCRLVNNANGLLSYLNQEEALRQINRDREEGIAEIEQEGVEAKFDGEKDDRGPKGHRAGHEGIKAKRLIL